MHSCQCWLPRQQLQPWGGRHTGGSTGQAPGGAQAWAARGRQEGMAEGSWEEEGTPAWCTVPSGAETKPPTWSKGANRTGGEG